MTMKNNKLYILWMGILGALIVLGVYTTFKALVIGSDDIFHADNDIPWTLLIATYIFFVLTSTGATIIASLSSVFGYKKYEPIEKRAIFIGIITLFAGFLAMGLELGRPINMFYYFLTPNLSSPIWWMGFFYMCLLVVLLLEFWHIHTKKPDSKRYKIVPLIALVLEIAALSTLGSVFGLIEARPTFFGEYIQTYFLFTAMLSGLSAIFFFSLINYRLRFGKIPDTLELMFNSLAKIFGAIIGFVLILSVWRIILGLYSNRPEFDVLHYFVDSNAYRVEIFFGLMVPFAILIISKLRETFWGKLIAAILVFIGLGIGRLDMIMIGQIQPSIPKLPDTEIIKYFPTFWEWAIGAFAMALMLMLYTLGERYLKLETHVELPSNKKS